MSDTHDPFRAAVAAIDDGDVDAGAAPAKNQNNALVNGPLDAARHLLQTRL